MNRVNQEEDQRIREVPDVKKDKESWCVDGTLTAISKSTHAG